MANTESIPTQALAQAWDNYHVAIERARMALEATPRFRDNPDHRAQAYYSLAESQAMAYNLAIAPRMNDPLVNSRTSWATYFYTLGGNCSDFLFGAIFLDGRRSYRITARRGDLKFVLMQVFNHFFGHPKQACIGNHDLSMFTPNADGLYEIVASATPCEGNWIPLAAESEYNFIFMRRAITDWYGDCGTFNVELIGEPEVYDEFSEDALAERLKLAADYLIYTTEKFAIGFYELCLKMAGGKKNVSALLPGQDIASEIAGNPRSNYAHTVFDIAPDEALIFELDVPKGAAYWQFQLYDVWIKSLDFMHRQTDINMDHAAIDADGKFRAVIAMEDPGIANWLDPVGRREGIVVFRNYGASDGAGEAPNPGTRLVKLADLRNCLPPDTRLASPAEREKALERRRQGYKNIYD